MRLRKEAAVLLALDLSLALVAWWAAFWLRFNLNIPDEFADLAARTSPWLLVSYTIGLSVARVYRHVWRYSGLPELRQLGRGVLQGSVLTAVAVLILRYPDFPRSVLLLQPLIALVLLGAVRAGWRTFKEHVPAPAGSRPLLIIGTLSEAADALRALKGSTQWQPAGIVSPLQNERGLFLQTVPVVGTIADLGAVARSAEIDTALVASPPGAAARRLALLTSADAGLTLLTLPRPGEWLNANTHGPRRIELEDLLGRVPVQLDVAGLSGLFAGQTVLVTGAGGSIGSELCRQIARFGVGSLVCIDASEYAVYQLEQSLRTAHPQLKVLYYTANVREAGRLLAIAQLCKPAVVFHAAANKHVPLMEELNEIEALRTNVLGTLYCAQAAGACGAQRFVLVSTDKAVNPTNVMGASKRLAEKVVQGVANNFPNTQFVSVRFGNVLGSSGSVVPLFHEQIAKGGPVTVTHPDIVRYFMTIPEAAQLVLQAGLVGASKQIFVLDMGEPLKIAELARLMLRLSGKTEFDIPIVYTGLRPGEKLFEELLANDETTAPTPHPKLRISKIAIDESIDVSSVETWISQIESMPSKEKIRAWLKGHISEYSPSSTPLSPT